MAEIFEVVTTEKPAPAPPTNPGASGEACRYLAAGAYRDAEFRKSVLEFVRHGWYRARAPEFGIDEQLVVGHCKKAERRLQIRNLLMLVAFVAVAHEAIGWLMNSPEEFDQILAYFAGSIVAGIAVAGLILFAERLYTEHFTIARKFNRLAFAGMREHRENQTDTDSKQNLVIYGGYSPFVGSGYQIGGWSFSINLERTKEDLTATHVAIPFETDELTDFVGRRLDRLRIDGLNHYEVLFADGRFVRDDKGLLSERNHPLRHIAQQAIVERQDSPLAGTRSYLCICVPDWSGEIVVSIYLRFKKGESNLFTEASYLVLAPPKRQFYAIDELDSRLHLSTIARIFFASAVTAPFILALSVFAVLAWILAPLSHWTERRRIRRTIKRNPSFNFGAVTSIRELGMENYYRVYFQHLDKERHVKTIEQCTIDAIVEFLADHNIDTSDIRDRRSAILNNGVIVSGGYVNAESLAVGAGARSTVARLRSKMSRGSAGRPPTAKSAA